MQLIVNLTVVTMTSVCLNNYQTDRYTTSNTNTTVATAVTIKAATDGPDTITTATTLLLHFTLTFFTL